MIAYLIAIVTRPPPRRMRQLHLDRGAELFASYRKLGGKKVVADRLARTLHDQTLMLR